MSLILAVKYFGNDTCLICWIIVSSQAYGLLKHLFKQTHKDAFIKKACINTSQRIKQNKPVTPAFLFAVFLWQAQNNRFTHIKKKQRSFNLAMMQAPKIGSFFEFWIDALTTQYQKVITHSKSWVP
jgi:hypothetical protein